MPVAWLLLDLCLEPGAGLGAVLAAPNPLADVFADGAAQDGIVARLTAQPLAVAGNQLQGSGRVDVTAEAERADGHALAFPFRVRCRCPVAEDGLAMAVPDAPHSPPGVIAPRDGGARLSLAALCGSLPETLR